MTTYIQQTASDCHRNKMLQNVFTIILSCILFAACSPATSQATPPTYSTSTPSLPDSSATAKPAATEEMYPTFTPAPTFTALPTLQPSQSLSIKTLHMVDEQNGWGIEADGHILHTTDGGWTWKDVTPRSGAYQDSGFFALDAATAWATPYQAGCFTMNCPPKPNNASIWHTKDGGNTWQEQPLCLQSQQCNFSFDTGTDYYYPIALQFVDSNHGWLLIVVAHMMFQDRYRLYQTTDSGQHWIPELDNITGPFVMSATDLAFQNGQMGWFATSQIDGATDPKADWSIYQSIDSGLNWNEFQLPEPNPLPDAFTGNSVWCGAYNVETLSTNAVSVTIHCRVYTDPVSNYEFYFHSIDEGKTWNSWLKTGDVNFITNTIGWRSSTNKDEYDLEQTRDGGLTWTWIKSVRWNGDFDFVNEQIGWAIATNNDNVALVHTTDGGKTWEEIKPVVADK